MVRYRKATRYVVRYVIDIGSLSRGYGLLCSLEISAALQRYFNSIIIEARPTNVNKINKVHRLAAGVAIAAAL